MMYKTKIIKINEKKEIGNLLDEAISIIKSKQVVAIPTETVYGLAADAFDSKAVERIYEAKGRPSDNPLIIHISDSDQLKKIAKYIPKKAKSLMKAFWPGALTIILRKKKQVPFITTGGRESVGVRMPNHKVALELIKKTGPLAAPSANSFGKPSPTLALHVLEDLDGKIPLIIDGGKSNVGVESTIIDFTQKIPMILRPGGITIEQIEKEIGTISLHKSVLNPKKQIKDALAPGMKYRHYSPKAKVILIQKGSIKNILKKYPDAGTITMQKHISSKGPVKQVDSLEDFAKEVFAFFREMDSLGIKTIIVDKVPETGIGLSILNRVKKAASKII